MVIKTYLLTFFIKKKIYLKNFKNEVIKLKKIDVQYKNQKMSSLQN